MIKKLTALAVAGAFLVGGMGQAFAYTVQPNDTMFKIARNHEMSLTELVELNPQINNINLIYPNQQINTVKNENNMVKNTGEKMSVANAEIELLSRLVQAEAGSEPYAGKVAVAEVVLNRVASGQFPNTVQGVIYQPRQFTPVSNGSINKTASPDSIKAVNEALNGSNYAKGALFFYNPKTATSRWLDNKPTVTVIGNHSFK